MILVRGDITTVLAGLKTQVAFKNCVPFKNHHSLDNAENLDLVMVMYNLLEYSFNYSNTTASLWFYTKGEVANFNDNIENAGEFKSFKYQAKLLGGTVAKPNPNQIK